jgi:CBS domain-containing protein
MATAKDIMNHNVATITRDASAMDAVIKMNDERVSSLIVDKSNPRDAYGIVTMGDVICRVVASGLSLHDVKLHEIMTKPLIWVLPDMSVKHIARLFANNDISRAPVIDHNELVGIITFHDILADPALIDQVI